MAIRDPFLTTGTHRTAPLPTITCSCCGLRRKYNERHVSVDNIPRCMDCINHYPRLDEEPKAEGDRAIAHEPLLRERVRLATDAANRMEQQLTQVRSKVAPALRSRDKWRSLATDAVRLHSSKLNGCECGKHGEQCPTERLLLRDHGGMVRQAVERSSPEWGFEESDLAEY